MRHSWYVWSFFRFAGETGERLIIISVYIYVSAPIIIIIGIYGGIQQTACTYETSRYKRPLTLVGPQPRFGDKSLGIIEVCPQNRDCGVKGVNIQPKTPVVFRETGSKKRAEKDRSYINYSIQNGPCVLLRSTWYVLFNPKWMWSCPTAVFGRHRDRWVTRETARGQAGITIIIRINKCRRSHTCCALSDGKRNNDNNNTTTISRRSTREQKWAKQQQQQQQRTYV